ncbi:helix-turn-helix domain-containing protein [Streptomyces sp. NPDC005859]|uniref:helix-turn-helix domain-containing protein n=1 Tax=Streptomyces sp. NPDC005859 TaxID=3157170 RepID=UPI0033F6973C
MRILKAFTPDESALTVSEISRRTGLHVATVSRLVAELVSHGFLSRDADRRVRIGVRLWNPGTRASPTLSLRDAAMPFMEGGGEPAQRQEHEEVKPSVGEAHA